MKSCLTCTWFAVDILSNGDTGTCRRHAPLAAVVDQGRGQGPVRLAIWPPVGAALSCGDHEERKDPCPAP